MAPNTRKQKKGGKGKGPQVQKTPQNTTYEETRTQDEEYDFFEDESVPVWAKYMMEHLGNRINGLGEFTEGINARVNKLVSQTALGATSSQGITIGPTATIPATANTVAVDPSEVWAKLVERFNKIKPPVFTGKKDATVAARWKDSMAKVFDILKVGPVDQMRLGAFNLEGAAWEWWRSATTALERDTLTWEQFVIRFDRMFIPRTVVNAKEIELLKLEQGTMTVDEYEIEFRELCHFAVDLHLDEERRARMFEKGLREEIQMVVRGGLYREYSQVVESARNVEQALFLKRSKEEFAMKKEKAKDDMPQEVSVIEDDGKNKQEARRDKRHYYSQGNDGWKRQRNDNNFNRGRKIEGNCWKCGIKGHRGDDCRNPYRIAQPTRIQSAEYGSLSATRTKICDARPAVICIASRGAETCSTSTCGRATCSPTRSRTRASVCDLSSGA